MTIDNQRNSPYPTPPTPPATPIPHFIPIPTPASEESIDAFEPVVVVAAAPESESASIKAGRIAFQGRLLEKSMLRPDEKLSVVENIRTAAKSTINDLLRGNIDTLFEKIHTRYFAEDTGAQYDQFIAKLQLRLADIDNDLKENINAKIEEYSE